MLFIIESVIFCVNVCNSRKIKTCGHIKTDIKICPEYRVIYANVFTPSDKSLQNKKKILKIKYSQATTANTHICLVSSLDIPQGGRLALSPAL